MLLKSVHPSEEDIFTTMTGPNINTDALPSPPGPHHHHTEGHGDDDGDDVWGSPTTASAPEISASHHHPSDVPRLRQEHFTSGYREGVTAAKSESIQAGFDEGFGLGATIGARAGRLLGLLEGIAAAVGAATTTASGSGGSDDAAGEVKHLLETAREELGIKSVFGPDYWEADGTWKYEVVAAPGNHGKPQEGDALGEETDEVVFADVAAAHPLLKKWEALVQREVERWDVDLTLLNDDEGVARDHGETQPKRKDIKPVAQSREALQW